VKNLAAPQINFPAVSRRLIVLVPADLKDIAGLAHKTHWLAEQQQRDVLYLSLTDEEDDLSVTRMLATMEAITRDTWLRVHSMTVEAENWVEAIRQVYQPGDTLVCHEGQVEESGLWSTIPLRQRIEKEFRAPVSTLQGFYSAPQAHSRRWLHSLMFWLGSAVILAGFSYLEFSIDHWISGVARGVILMILVLLESGLIYKWNEISG